ncbi:hypothetical protein PAGA_a1244 [Pseudoalteromonas agarivorans DSM 14585]|jgi:hypothetical protein|uniref:Uncharacterized protein n=1 Tax=Pseudoalteromonas agarivorans DSM 14585 TaxID=1312369 RepID=A0ACA8DU48_9GAMM|nr:hypothetical protein PAGA_a1244 [Pseudoalteromonas agarivorans DSM 14585]|tara:strand:+ start:721 stop:858 length:138 start_codon:yes stop_codon:yes gene_type:complete
MQAIFAEKARSAKLLLGYKPVFSKKASKFQLSFAIFNHYELKMTD